MCVRALGTLAAAVAVAAVALCAGGALAVENLPGLQEHGLYTLVLNSSLLQCTFNKSLGLDVSLMKIYQYDFTNDVNASYYLNQSAASILADPSFELTRKTLVWVPGFTDTIDGSNQENIRQNLKYFNDSYLYIVDHHNYTYSAGTIQSLESYERSVKYCWDIGSGIAGFLADLVAGGVSLEGIYVIGHSLGGQIVSSVGESYYNRTGTLLPRVLGSDPAAPCFDHADREFQLRSGIARHVETYHCNAGQLGTVQDLTDAFYYVNGGSAQPGCNTPLIPEVYLSAKASSCSHNTCPKVVTLPARLTQLWPALVCDSLADFAKGSCASNDETVAGLYSFANNTGIHYFDTTGYLT